MKHTFTFLSYSWSFFKRKTPSSSQQVLKNKNWKKWETIFVSKRHFFFGTCKRGLVLKSDERRLRLEMTIHSIHPSVRLSMDKRSFISVEEDPWQCNCMLYDVKSYNCCFNRQTTNNIVDTLEEMITIKYHFVTISYISTNFQTWNKLVTTLSSEIPLLK